VIELGTKEYPFTKIGAAFKEILNYHSYRNESIIIFLKENSENVVEDDMNFLIGINNVTITSYSESANDPERATLILTSYFQPTKSQKAILNIMDSEIHEFDNIISQGNFSDSEKLSFKVRDVSIKAIQTSLTLNNLNVERSISDIDLISTFVHTFGLHSKWLRMTNMAINVTGVIHTTSDPENIFLQNLLIDACKLFNGFIILMN
jgi:hypothetical protein